MIAQPVPVELELDSSVAIRVNFRACRADDNGGMQARIADRLAMVVAAGAPPDVFTNAREAVLVVGEGAWSDLVIIRYFMVDGQDQVAAVLDIGVWLTVILSCAQFGTEVAAKLERAAG